MGASDLSSPETDDPCLMTADDAGRHRILLERTEIPNLNYEKFRLISQIVVDVYTLQSVDAKATLHGAMHHAVHEHEDARMQARNAYASGILEDDHQEYSTVMSDIDRSIERMKSVLDLVDGLDHLQSTKLLDHIEAVKRSRDDDDDIEARCEAVYARMMAVPAA